MMRFTALAFGVFALWALPATASDDASPQQILAEIYSAYGPDSAPQNVPDRFFAPELLTLYDAVEADTPPGEMAIDFDIFIDAQDLDRVADLSFYVWDAPPSARVIDAKFTVSGEPRSIRYSFVKTPQGWKIDNIVWRGESENLRSYLTGLRARQQTP